MCNIEHTFFFLMRAKRIIKLIITHTFVEVGSAWMLFLNDHEYCGASYTYIIRERSQKARHGVPKVHARVSFGRC